MEIIDFPIPVVDVLGKNLDSVNWLAEEPNSPYETNREDLLALGKFILEKWQDLVYTTKRCGMKRFRFETGYNLTNRFRKKRWMDYADFEKMSQLCFGEEIPKDFISDVSIGTLIPRDYDSRLNVGREPGH